MMIEFPPSLWRKSSRSGGGSGQCVEVAITSAAVGVRDTKARKLGHFTVSPAQWAAFTSQVKDGAFDL